MNKLLFQKKKSLTQDNFLFKCDTDVKQIHVNIFGRQESVKPITALKDIMTKNVEPVSYKSTNYEEERLIQGFKMFLLKKTTMQTTTRNCHRNTKILTARYHCSSSSAVKTTKNHSSLKKKTRICKIKCQYMSVTSATILIDINNG